MKYVLIAALGLFSLTACDAITGFASEPEKPVAQMSTQELVDALASVDQGEKARAINLRLASTYERYGSDAQKRNYAGKLVKMATGGDMDAASLLCSDIYLEISGKDGLTACAQAADAGAERALIKMCRLNFMTEAFDDAVSYCTKGETLGLPGTYMPMGILTAKGLGGTVKSPYRAIGMLERAAEEGPFQDRDPAIDMLRDIPEAANYAEIPSLQDTKGPSQTPAKLTQTAEPAVPARMSKKGQCYLTYEITPTGLVYKAKVDCNDERLVAPVLEAAHKWRFSPRKVQGQALYSRNQSTTLVFE